MATLKVTAKGQVTLKKDVLAHIGARAGDTLEVDLMPNGRLQMSKPARGRKTLADLAGMARNDTDVKLTLEEMNEIIAKGWAGQL